MAAKTRIDLQRVRRQTKRWSTENVEKTTHHKKSHKSRRLSRGEQSFFQEKVDQWQLDVWYSNTDTVPLPVGRRSLSVVSLSLCPTASSPLSASWHRHCGRTRHRHPSLWPHAAGRSQRQTPAVRRRWKCQQAAAARTALRSYSEGSTDPGILDWCPGCRLCAGPHPPCPHTPRDLGEHCPAQHTEDPAAVQHSATPAPWLRQSDSVRLLQAATNPGDDVQTPVITSDHKAVTADTDCLRARSPVTARCKYKKKTKHQPPSRVDYLFILRVNLTRKFAAIKSMFWRNYFCLFLQFKRIAINWEEIGRKVAEL